MSTKRASPPAAAPPESQAATPDPRAAELAELGLATASLMHEIRQPLFALKAHLHLMRLQGGPDLSGLEDQVAWMEELVAFYGSLAGHEGQPDLPFDLNHEVAGVLRVLEHQARQRRIRLDVSLHVGPLVLHGRSVAARQVLVNLVRNALDAVAKQDLREVRIRTGRDGDHAELHVEDTGPGIHPKVLDRVFEPWVSTKGNDGTGLGLFLTRNLVDDLGGSVQIEPLRPQGTRFVVRMPLST